MYGSIMWSDEEKCGLNRSACTTVEAHLSCLRLREPRIVAIQTDDILRVDFEDKNARMN